MDDNRGWVFLSHSHLDIEIVRQIRNKFEDLGFEPLMFYLKCLNDEDEIEDLIKREINEREWFVYIDSENSRKSRWVQTEREYISNLDDKKIFTINIDKEVSKQVKNISNKLKVFVYYSSEHQSDASKLIKQLKKAQYKVYSGDQEELGRYWEEDWGTIQNIIKDGYTIIFNSKSKEPFHMVNAPILNIITNSGNIISLKLGRGKMIDLLTGRKGHNHTLEFNKKLSDKDINSIVEFLEKLTKESTDVNFFNTSDKKQD